MSAEPGGSRIGPATSIAARKAPHPGRHLVDEGLVEQGDILSALDAGPNLMDLTPAAFEALVSNLFSKMGLETKLTRTSKDGGVDAVTFDTRPVLGGKIVIQAKRYKNTVGVSAVRDLSPYDAERGSPQRHSRYYQRLWPGCV